MWTSQKYLSYQARWKEYCAEKNIICDSLTVEQFLNFFTELLNQRVSHSVLISTKSAVALILRMKYQHIPQYRSVMKSFAGPFNLRPPLPKLSFVRDVQIMSEYFRNPQGTVAKSQIFITKTLNTTTASRRATPKLYISFYNW